MSCNLCPHALPAQVSGRGPLTPALIVLGENPNGDDESNGRPFSAGRNPNKEYPNLIIPRALAAIGVPEDHIYFAYALRCNPWHHTKPVPVKASHLATCRSAHLDPALSHVNCQVILACGDLAMKTLLPEAEGGVAKNRGTWHESVIGGQKRLVRVTFAPNFIQRMSLFHAVELPNGKLAQSGRWNPPGSCGWFFQKDLRAVRAKLKELGLMPETDDDDDEDDAA